MIAGYSNESSHSPMLEPLLRTIARALQDALQFREDWIRHSRHTGPDFASRARRAIEQARLLRTSAMDAEDYYRLGLHRTDMSFADKRRFIGKYRSARYYQRINPLQYEVFGHDKVLMHLLALQLGVPMAPVLASTAGPGDPVIGEHLAGLNALREFLLRPASQSLFLKPCTGTLGLDTLALGERLADSRSWRRIPGRGSIDLEEVVAHCMDANGRMRRFLVQPRLAPHPALARIVPEVLHTVRVGTLFEGGRVHVLGAALRMGAGTRPTDNAMDPGGISIPFDLHTGVLGEGLEVADGVARRRPDHPVTHHPFAGSVLPYWREALDTAEAAARGFSFIPWLSWDVGICESGPVITEFNTRSRWTSVQAATGKGLLAGKLGEVLSAHAGIGTSGLRHS